MKMSEYYSYSISLNVFEGMTATYVEMNTIFKALGFDYILPFLPEMWFGISKRTDMYDVLNAREGTETEQRERLCPSYTDEQWTQYWEMEQAEKRAWQKPIRLSEKQLALVIEATDIYGRRIAQHERGEVIDDTELLAFEKRCADMEYLPYYEDNDDNDGPRKLGQEEDDWS